MYSGEIITSCANPLVKILAKLGDAKYRREEGLFLCEGKKLAEEALQRADVKYLLVSDSQKDSYSDLCDLADSVGAKVDYLAEAPFAKISTEKAPQGIIAVCAIPDSDKSLADSKHIFMCDGVRDPGNLGTIFRTAGALGFDTVVISDCADVYNPKTVRASMGGIFRLNIVCSVDAVQTVRALRDGGRRVFAAALKNDSKILGNYDLKESDVFIVGNEGHGLSDEVISECTDTVLIEMSSETESLNVSAASVIIMWEISKTF